jgi:hypothetical protein
MASPNLAHIGARYSFPQCLIQSVFSSLCGHVFMCCKWHVQGYFYAFEHPILLHSIFFHSGSSFIILDNNTGYNLNIIYYIYIDPFKSLQLYINLDHVPSHFFFFFFWDSFADLAIIISCTCFDEKGISSNWVSTPEMCA